MGPDCILMLQEDFLKQLAVATSESTNGNVLGSTAGVGLYLGS